MKNRNLVLLVTLLCGFYAAITTSIAQSTTNISFQGALTGTNGQALANGPYTLTFKFYDVLSGGTALATSIVPNVIVSGGIASTPIPVEIGWFTGQTRYLGIGINNGQELTPRLLITAVPYALAANNLTSADIKGVNSLTMNSGGDVVLDGGAVIFKQTSLPTWYVRGLGGTFSIWESTHAVTPLAIDADTGTTSLKDLEIRDRGYFDPIAGGNIKLMGTTGRASWFIDVRGDDFRIFNSAHGIVPFDVNETTGVTSVQVLQIRGGADLAEHLSVTDGNSQDEFDVEPGMVVSIDSSGNRKFKLSDQPYDRKRVGIISGGNGVKPGLILGDEGNPAVAGEQPIALTGQVWVHADASFGAITPGDLLTTSSTPGHAMKVTDDNKARFAVLGQALTGLKEGRDWVQILVRCQ